MKILSRRWIGALATAGLVSGCATPPPVWRSVPAQDQPARDQPATSAQPGSPAAAPLPPLQPPLVVNLVALNDFHGHLEASKFTYAPTPGAALVSVQAGGIGTLAAALQAWRAEDPELLLVAAGDLIGGTPALSSMWADEPALTALDMLGLRVSSAGNHEFDNGYKELLRQQHGGCNSNRPDKACKYAPDFGGTRFVYLAANVIDKKTGKTLLPAYRLETVRGVKIALIGAVLRDTASVVLPSGIAGLSFTDEADAINHALHAARADGATVFVVLIHEGAHTDEGFSEPDCSRLKGPVVDIANRLDPAIRLIISGHTHTGFQCKIGERVITQAEMGGHVLSRIKLGIDPVSRSLHTIAVNNVVMTPGAYPAVPHVERFLADVQARSDAVLSRPVARVAATGIGRQFNRAGEAALGDLVADGVLHATRRFGVQIGLMNIAGLRRDMDADASMTVTEGMVQAILPFGNTLVVMDLSGAQLLALLEQQWRGGVEPTRSMLQVSEGFTYQWSPSRPAGQRIVPGSVKVRGVPVTPGGRYRIATNNFLAEGGDSLPMFKEGTRRSDTGIRDVDALRAYLKAREAAGRPAGSAAAAGRIVRVQ